MTIDEAIAHEREIAEMHRSDIVPKEMYHNMPWIDKNNEVNMRSAEEHEQLAEWLEELKMYKSLAPRELVSGKQKNDRTMEYSKGFDYGFKTGYNKALNDFVNVCENQFTTMYGQRYIDMRDIVNISEQLKAGEQNE